MGIAKGKSVCCHGHREREVLSYSIDKIMLYYEKTCWISAKERMHLHSLVRHATGADKHQFKSLQDKLKEAAGL